MKRLILFDLDGTLIDSGEDITNSVNHVRAAFHLPAISKAQALSYVGNGQQMLLKRSLHEIDGHYDWEEALAVIRDYYSAHLLEHTVLYPGAIETLTILKREGAILGVVSNKPSAGTHVTCEILKIKPFMDVILGGGDTPQLKPSPEPLLKALAATGADAEISWMVGDNYTDLKAAADAGMRACFCTYGFGKACGERIDAEIQSLAELPEKIRQD